MIWIEVALRIAIGCAAFAILYVAWFVYEDEEKELQSRIEGWWLNFDDVRVSMISRQAAVVSVVARKATEVLDGVFGPRLFAKDSVAAATCFSVAGYVVIIFLSKYLEGRSDAVTWAFALAAIGLFICGVAPLVSVQFRRLPRAVLSVRIIVGEFSSNSARSRTRRNSWSLTRIAQISFSLNGAFWPTSLPCSTVPGGDEQQLHPW